MKKFLFNLVLAIGSILGLSSLSSAQQNYNFVVGGLVWASGSSVPGSCVLDGSWYWLNTGSKAWYVCTNGTYALPLATASGGSAFSAITSGTNNASLIIGTGGSLSTSGSGTISATTALTAANLSGTPALPNGTTATTQSPGDNSTKIATDAFATALIGSPVQGQLTIGGANSILNTSPGSVFISAYCLSTTTCTNVPLGITDESGAFQYIIQTVYPGNAATLHIVDDMCGRQTWSQQPFTGMSGIVDLQSNCGNATPTNTHVISVDGIGTVALPSQMQLRGLGLSGFAQVPAGGWIEACNPNINNCLHGGFTVPHATVSSTVVAGANMTITLGSAIPISGNGYGVAAQYRLLYINGSTTQVSNNGAWVINTTTDTTHMIVNVVNGVTQSCTPGTCGTVSLDTPLIGIGSANGAGAFGTRAGNIVVNCNYVIGCGGFVNAAGQEHTGIDFIEVFNADVFYGRVDQSGAYNGSGIAGATNSGPYGPWAGNTNPILCSKTGGCSCITGSGSGTTGGVSNVCTGGIVPVGGTVSCGAGLGATNSPAVLNPDPCDNPNFVGFAMTGVAGPNGFGEVLRVTSSISDKSVGGGSPIPGYAGGVHNFGSNGCVCSTGSQPGSSAATTGTGIFVGGAHAAFGDSHTEYFYTDIEIGGNTALNATWAEAYNSVPTTGVIFHGGLHSFQSGGVGVDIGTSSANRANIQDINFEAMNIGLGGVSIQDNVNSLTCNDPTVSYFLGHGTNSSTVITSCTTIPQVSILTLQLNGATSGNVQLSSSATGTQLVVSQGLSVGAITASGGISLTGTSGANTTISTTTTNASIFLTPNGTGQVIGPAGTTTVPGFGFTGSLTTGISAEATNVLGLLSNGVLVAIATGGIEITSNGTYKFSQTAAANGGVGAGLTVVGTGTTEALSPSTGGNTTGLILQPNQCKVIAATSMTVSGTAVNFCTWSLPSSAQVWAYQCSGTYSITGTTTTFGLNMGIQQTPSATNFANAIIYSNLVGGDTAGSNSTASTGNVTILTGASITGNVSNIPFELNGTIQASATVPDQFSLSSTLTGTFTSGSVNPGTTCTLY